MVYLNRIYTRGGDAGETALGSGDRVKKTHPRITAYGGVDELNSVLGLALTVPLPEEFAIWLQGIQNDLFDVGADLCVPLQPSAPPPEHPPLRVRADQVTALETKIDTVNERLEPLTNFVLPGGSPAAAHLHHARSVCRRVEIGVVALQNDEPDAVNLLTVTYLNRLSDLLFVLARACNEDGNADILWTPGGAQSPAE
ncbi:MAG: cob(I)yrinic acid a,c-diamide adenosyltransferase [Planctomycetaceae bacterium]